MMAITRASLAPHGKNITPLWIIDSVAGVKRLVISKDNENDNENWNDNDNYNNVNNNNNNNNWWNK